MVWTILAAVVSLEHRTRESVGLQRCFVQYLERLKTYLPATIMSSESPLSMCRSSGLGSEPSKGLSSVVMMSGMTGLI